MGQSRTREFPCSAFRADADSPIYGQQRRAGVAQRLTEKRKISGAAQARSQARLIPTEQ